MMLTYLLRFMLIVSLGIGARREGPWWSLIPEGLRLIFFLAVFFVSLLVLAVVLYLAGLIVVGRKLALLRDAFTISLLGTVLSNLFFMFIPYPLVALLLSIAVWLLLIKRLYETGWFGAIAVGILAAIIYLAIAIILALIFGIIEMVWELLYFSFISIL